jgi:hypothetical protein
MRVARSVPAAPEPKVAREARENWRRIVRHGALRRLLVAEVAVPRALFAIVLRRIDRLRKSPVAAA